MKHITITNCGDCPKRHTGGGWASPQYVPHCTETTPDWRELPFTEAPGLGGRTAAKPTNVIPDWCPLDDCPGDHT